MALFYILLSLKAACYWSLQKSISMLYKSKYFFARNLESKNKLAHEIDQK